MKVYWEPDIRHQVYQSPGPPRNAYKTQASKLRASKVFSFFFFVGYESFSLSPNGQVTGVMRCPVHCLSLCFAYLRSYVYMRTLEEQMCEAWEDPSGRHVLRHVEQQGAHNRLQKKRLLDSRQQYSVFVCAQGLSVNVTTAAVGPYPS